MKMSRSYKSYKFDINFEEYIKIDTMSDKIYYENMLSYEYDIYYNPKDYDSSVFDLE